MRIVGVEKLAARSDLDGASCSRDLTESERNTYGKTATRVCSAALKTVTEVVLVHCNAEHWQTHRQPLAYFPVATSCLRISSGCSHQKHMAIRRFAGNKTIPTFLGWNENKTYRCFLTWVTPKSIQVGGMDMETKGFWAPDLGNLCFLFSQNSYVCTFSAFSHAQLFAWSLRKKNERSQISLLAPVVLQFDPAPLL